MPPEAAMESVSTGDSGGSPERRGIPPDQSARPGDSRQRVVIIGLGNELVTDDGAGIHAVREVRRKLTAESDSRLPQGVSIVELAAGGFRLLDAIGDCDHCIVVDAQTTGTNPPGTISRTVRIPGVEAAAPISSHQLDFGQLLALAAALGSPLPTSMIIFGIEALDVTSYADRCTAEVAASLPRLAEMVCAEVHRLLDVPQQGNS